MPALSTIVQKGNIVGWQPIETAPKDGTRVLIVDEDGNVDLCCYRESFNTRQEFVRKAKDGDVYKTITYEDGYWESGIFSPTHWMPLPPPPKE